MSDTHLNGTVGAASGLVSGTGHAVRLNRSGAVLSAGMSGKYQEAALRGACFSGSTAITGVAPGTSISTTAAFSLYNPAASTVNLVVLRASAGYVSGTFGAGVAMFVANTNNAAAATTGTAITAVNCLFGGGHVAQGRPLTTATLPATPTLVRPFYSLGASLASTAVQPWQIDLDIDGEFVVAPGCTLSIHAAAAAGTSPLVVYGMMWEEVAV